MIFIRKKYFMPTKSLENVFCLLYIVPVKAYKLYGEITMAERKLVGTEEMFKKALAGGYAIGAYNVNNMEILQGIAEAAEETRSPIILQVSAGARKYANQTYLIKLVEAALATTTVPIALHLDHGADFEICKACIEIGRASCRERVSSPV